MISVNNLSIQFTGNKLFDNVSFIINDKDRIGLVGKNGTGKTTLLKIIANLQEPHSGEVIIPVNTTVGYLPQEMNINSKKSIYDEAVTAFSDIQEFKNKIEQYSSEISERDDYESKSYLNIIHKLTEANEKFQLAGGQTIEADTEKILTGLGFTKKDFIRPMSEFSNGWQMRVELAKILLKKPNVLLLDEPTNHLDIESIQWLEDFLINYYGAVILVSHDRAFLDNITRRTIEISLGKIYDYKVSYSDYVKLREERIEQQTAAYNNQQNQIKQIERFIERFRYKSTKARQVQSRIKMLNKIDIVEIDDMDHSAIHFKFP
ncbi:MAG: ABC-F family ATP-binding cassette domain-containing protein, partial [Bacteroidales bacterium]|nr:ABC-F family ATP-binding cassette domain-containing protein [Bacteroidales bacterium]